MSKHVIIKSIILGITMFLTSELFELFNRDNDGPLFYIVLIIAVLSVANIYEKIMDHIEKK